MPLDSKSDQLEQIISLARDFKLTGNTSNCLQREGKEGKKAPDMDARDIDSSLLSH